MSFFKIVISDLHLADGHPTLDGSGDRQQSSFEGLLSAVVPTGNHEGPVYRDTELITHDDCFDLPVVLSYKTDGVTDSSTVAEKLEKVIVTHGPFLESCERIMGITRS